MIHNEIIVMRSDEIMITPVASSTASGLYSGTRFRKQLAKPLRTLYPTQLCNFTSGNFICKERIQRKGKAPQGKTSTAG